MHNLQPRRAPILTAVLLTTLALTTVWLYSNRVEITISTEDQRTVASQYERDGMSDFAYHCQTHIRF